VPNLRVRCLPALQKGVHGCWETVTTSNIGGKCVPFTR
jgi:hypothetical protein